MKRVWGPLLSITAIFCSTVALSQTWTAVPGASDRVTAVAAEWPSGVSIVARCGGERGLDVLIPLVQPVDQDHVAVEFLSAQGVSEQRWRLSDNGRVLFVRQPGWFSRAMINREPISVVVIPDDGPRQRYELDSPDGESALANVVSECGHPVTSPINEEAIVSNPDWVRRPDGGSLAQWYPVSARDRGIDGEAVIQCRVKPTGRLDDCIILSESPEGEEFGPATIAIADDFRMTPQRVNGVAMGETLVNIPIRWTIAPYSSGGTIR